MIKETGKGIIIKVKVIPNSKSFKITRKNNWLQAIEVKVKSPATENKANKELIREFKKILNSEIKIIQGKKSKIKRLLIKTNKTNLTEKLSVKP